MRVRVSSVPRSTCANSPTAATTVVAIAITAAMTAVVPAAGAQMPGQPVLQNAFANPGITIGADFGEQSGASGFGGALAWAPATGRFQLSAGGGVVHYSGGGASTSAGAWG